MPVILVPYHLRLTMQRADIWTMESNGEDQLSDQKVDSTIKDINARDEKENEDDELEKPSFLRRLTKFRQKDSDKTDTPDNETK